MMPINRRRWLLRLAAAVFVLVVAYMGYSALARHRSMERRRIALANLQKIGVPLTASERAAFCQIPPEETDLTEDWAIVTSDSLNLSNRLFRDGDKETILALPFVGMDDAGHSIPPRGTEWSQETVTSNYVKEFQEVLDRARKLAATGGAWRYISERDLGDGKTHPLSGYQRLTKLLLLNAHLEARNRNANQSLEDLLSALGIIEAGRYEAECSTVMDLGKLHRLASLSAVRLAAANGWSDPQLSGLQRALGKADFKSRMKRGYIGDISNHLTRLKTESGTAEDLYFAEGISLHAEMMLPVIAGYDSQWPAVFPSQLAYTKKVLALQEAADRVRIDQVHLLIAPLATHLWADAAATTTMQRVAVLILARQRRLLEEGDASVQNERSLIRWIPDEMDVSDPVTGKSLLERTDETGTIIYGVGENHVDDGGNVVRTNSYETPLDAGVRTGWHIQP